MHRWDLKKRESFRGKAGKSIKAFIGAECISFRSLAQARDQLGYSRYFINKALASGEPLEKYIFEYD